MKRDDINTLFKKYGPTVYRRALQILGNEADAKEAAQEVFIRAIRHSEGFEGRSQVSTWLYRITTNYCLNKIRDSKRRRELVQEHGLRPEMDGGLPTQALADHVVLVRRLLSVADAEQARAALCVYVDGMSHAEAAKILKVSRRTVGNLLDRFNEWAQKYVKDQGGQRARGV